MKNVRGEARGPRVCPCLTLHTGFTQHSTKGALRLTHNGEEEGGRKIFRKTVIEISFGRTVKEDAYEYSGEIYHAKGTVVFPQPTPQEAAIQAERILRQGPKIMRGTEEFTP